MFKLTTLLGVTATCALCFPQANSGPTRSLSPKVRQCWENVHFHPNDADAHYALGVALLADGSASWPSGEILLPTKFGSTTESSLKSAIPEFREAVRLRPDHAQSHARLAEVLEWTYKVDEAIREYREAIRLRQDEPDPYLELINLLESQGDYGRAIAEYRELARLKPDDFYIRLGQALYLKGPTHRATAEFRALVNKRPDAAQLHEGLAVKLTVSGRIAEYREVLRLKPNDSEAQEQLDYLVKGKTSKEKQIAKLRGWLRRKPDDAEAVNLLSDLLFRISGDGEGAINMLEELLRLRPDDVSAALNLAECLLAYGKESSWEAADDFRERIRHNPPSAGLHAGLGILLRKLGDFDMAVIEFREAARLKPDNPEIHNLLSWALWLKGDRENANTENALARQLAKPEKAAIEVLRALNVACQSYRQEYGNYPSDLDLIDPLVADGYSRGGYNFIYQPGKPNEKATIGSYRLSAQWIGQIGPGKATSTSAKHQPFSTDQSGVIE
jgi:Flp pilus assembly protein TadD